MKSLDTKLAEVKTHPSSRAFIIADAKDSIFTNGPANMLHRANRRLDPQPAPINYLHVLNHE
jgi:hypothetical protein